MAVRMLILVLACVLGTGAFVLAGYSRAGKVWLDDHVDALRGISPRQIRRRRQDRAWRCQRNLRELQAMKERLLREQRPGDRSAPAAEELLLSILPGPPGCPSGGDYRANGRDAKVSCTASEPEHRYLELRYRCSPGGPASR